MTAIGAACRELTHLCACLPAALTRDATGAHGGQIAAGSVYNPDVMHAMEVLRREVPTATAHACELVGEPGWSRPVNACLLAIPRLAGRMHHLGHLEDERQLEDAVRWWTRITKQALGLRKPDFELRTADKPDGYRCPYHDDPPVLVATGDEGFLRRAGDGITVEWELGDRVYCPACGASWGPGEWLHLGRVLQEAS